MSKKRCQNGDTYIYIGETEKQIETRICQYLRYIRNKVLNQSTGLNFNYISHSQENIKFSVLEQPRCSDLVYRKEREKFIIKELNSYYRGLNRAPE